MTSARAKGSALERKAQKELKAAGYLTERARGQILWIPDGRGGRRPITKAVDLFGVADILAANPDHVRFVQVCSDDLASVSKRRAAMETVAPRFPPGVCLFEVWRWHGGRAKKSDRLARGWVKERFLPHEDNGRFRGPGWMRIDGSNGGKTP